MKKIFQIYTLLLFGCKVFSYNCRCYYSEWGSWTTCTKLCGGGIQERRQNIRYVDNVSCGHTHFGSECNICQRGYSTFFNGPGTCFVSYDNGLLKWGTDRRECNAFCYNGGIYESHFFNRACNCPIGTRGYCCEHVTTCGQPGTIQHGSFVGNDFTYNKHVQYKCDEKYNMTDPSQAIRTCSEQGYWTGSSPVCKYAESCESSPCGNGASCVNLLDSYQCNCRSGWTGKHCENDIQPPVMESCPADRNIFTAKLISTQTWEEPTFTDPHGKDIHITKNYQNSTFDFPWGEYTVQYNAVKPSNGLTAECLFKISIKPFPCDKMKHPANGIIACNNWRTNFTNVCIFICKENYTLPLQFSADDIFSCGATGRWLPPDPVSQCVTNGFFPWDDNSYRTFSSCSSSEDRNEIGAYYIKTLKKSAFNSLCLDYQTLCKPENVYIKC